MTNYPHLAQRLFNTPLAILPSKGEMVMAALTDRFGIAHLFRADGTKVSAGAWSGDDEFSGEAESPRGYTVVDGVAIIQVTGTLVAKLGTLRPYSGMTGYDGLRANFSLAMGDPKVKAIAFDIDSPGGEVSGCFDLVDAIYSQRGQKPIWAILSDSAYSAAYAIASAADRIIVPRTGGAGSIGVICMHVDFSKALSEAGFKVTFVTSVGADRKADGHPEIPLSPEALAAIQGEIDAMGELFYATVARNRGLTANAVRALKAATFLGGRSLEAGLADAVSAPDAAFRELIKL